MPMRKEPLQNPPPGPLPTGAGADAEGRQTIEELQERYQRLNTKKIESATLLQQAQKQLDNLKREAREKYGTDDLAALEAKLVEMKAENEAKRAAYQAELERIEADLAQVEQNFAATEATSGKG
jgi:SMC interacting uncharacterized protein involved in chromosome segregation